MGTVLDAHVCALMVETAVRCPVEPGLVADACWPELRMPDASLQAVCRGLRHLRELSMTRVARLVHPHVSDSSLGLPQKRGKGSEETRARIEEGLTTAGQQTSAAIDKLGAAGQPKIFYAPSSTCLPALLSTGGLRQGAFWCGVAVPAVAHEHHTS